ncbi:MAG: hypothetical protein DRP19_01735 [Thermotogae bacterium]|nr:MAG: hypothetical protein DRP19_01735 [Thermotogota bacterium]
MKKTVVLVFVLASITALSMSFEIWNGTLKLGVAKTEQLTETSYKSESTLMVYTEQGTSMGLYEAVTTYDRNGTWVSYTLKFSIEGKELFSLHCEQKDKIESYMIRNSEKYELPELNYNNTLILDNNFPMDHFENIVKNIPSRPTQKVFIPQLLLQPSFAAMAVMDTNIRHDPRKCQISIQILDSEYVIFYDEKGIVKLKVGTVTVQRCEN